ncbi:MAG: peptidoglycan-binding protein [Pseudomonadota bacterium]
MKRFALRSAALVAAALAFGATPVAAKDLAVFVENLDYSRVADVAQAKDAAQLKASLRNRGFDVIEARNANANDMRRILRRLRADVKDAERAFVFLHGHFAQGAGDAWLLSSRYERGDVMHAEHGALSLNLVAHSLSPASGRAVVFAAPSTRAIALGEGLSQGTGGLDMPQGITLVSGPGDNLMSLALNRLLNPNLSMNEALGAQRAGVTVTGFLPSAISFLDAPTVETQKPQPSDPDALAWQNAQSQNTAEAYLRYLQAFPRGKFTDQARTQLLALTTPQEPTAEEIETALNMSRAVRREVQQNLNLLGFNVGTPDGLFGPATRRGLSNWQRQARLEPTGYLTQAGLERLRADSNGLRQIETNLWERVTQADRIDAYQAYLRDYPQGRFAQTARDRIAALSQPVQTPQAPQVSQAQVAQAQSEEKAVTSLSLTRGLIENMLAAQGFNPGQRDGKFDANTRRAIKAMQEARGLPQTGHVDRLTMTRLLSGQ